MWDGLLDFFRCAIWRLSSQAGLDRSMKASMSSSAIMVCEGRLRGLGLEEVRGSEFATGGGREDINWGEGVGFGIVEDELLSLRKEEAGVG